MSISEKLNSVNLDFEFVGFSGEEKSILSKYIFDNKSLQGGILAMENQTKDSYKLNGRVQELKEIRKKFIAGEIDLGNKDLFWRVAQLIGSAALVTTVIGFGVFVCRQTDILFDIKGSLKANDGIAVAIAFYLVGLLFSITNLLSSIAKSSATRSPEKLYEELQSIKNQYDESEKTKLNLSSDDKKQLKAALEQLQSIQKEKSLSQSKKLSVGDEISAKQLENEIRILDSLIKKISPVAV